MFVAKRGVAGMGQMAERPSMEIFRTNRVPKQSRANMFMMSINLLMDHWLTIQIGALPVRPCREMFHRHVAMVSPLLRKKKG